MAERVRITGGNICGHDNEARDAQVDECGNLHTVTGFIDGKNLVYEDTSFVSGDSPAVHDFYTDSSGRSAVGGYIICDGNGSIRVDISRDGLSYDTKFTLYGGDSGSLEGLKLQKIRVTLNAAGTASAYRINLI